MWVMLINARESSGGKRVSLGAVDRRWLMVSLWAWRLADRWLTEMIVWRGQQSGVCQSHAAQMNRGNLWTLQDPHFCTSSGLLISKHRVFTYILPFLLAILSLMVLCTLLLWQDWSLHSVVLTPWTLRHWKLSWHGHSISPKPRGYVWVKGTVI